MPEYVEDHRLLAAGLDANRTIFEVNGYRKIVVCYFLDIQWVKLFRDGEIKIIFGSVGWRMRLTAMLAGADRLGGSVICSFAALTPGRAQQKVLKKG